MVVFTVDRHGSPGHPTRRFDLIRKLKKRGQVRIIGGGISGKPVTAVFLNKEFDASKMVDRQFVRVIDPGYQNIGYAVCEIAGNKIIIFCKGHLESRIPDIKGLMQDRKSQRRNRRHIARYKMRCLSHRQKRVLTKFKAPRYVRSIDKSSATLQHGVDVHLSLYGKMHKLCPLPVYQTCQIIERNTFNVRTMTWGKTSGKGYQQSPRLGQKSPAVCIVCGADKLLHEHHLAQRKNSGTDVKENKVYLCEGCHTDVHTGRVYLPVKGIKQWRALGTMNAIAGVLRHAKGLQFVSASDMAVKRRELGIEKEHGNDAVASAAALYDCTEVDDSCASYIHLKKFRRHSRQRIHALRDRNYKLDGKIIAKNRKKRMDQTFDSYADIFQTGAGVKKNLVVYPGVRVLNPFREDMPTIGGDTWRHIASGKRFVATGVSDKKYLFSPLLKEIVGRTYVSPDYCKRLSRNGGMVVWNS